VERSSESQAATRREVMLPMFMAGAAGVQAAPSASAAPSTAELLETAKINRKLLEPLPARIDAKEFDAVRFVIKNPPIQFIWDCANSRNTVRQLGESLADEEILNLFDEITTDMQNVDEYLYANAFVYTQPGDGKFRIEQPKEYLAKVMNSLDKVIKIASSQA